MEKANPNKRLPAYLKEIYGNFYNNTKLISWLDKPWLRAILSLGNNLKLIDAALKEVQQGDKVLQLGTTLGLQMEQTALRIGHYGQYDIAEVSNIQINRCKEKYGNLYTHMGYLHQNANEPVRGNYDVILCYMLLHEVPLPEKAKIINAALESVREGGKVVIVDYHQPSYWHPLRYVVRMFNRLYQPFAEALWDREIQSFVKDKSAYIWRRSLYFGGLYQKVVVDKKYTVISTLDASKQHDFIPGEVTPKAAAISATEVNMQLNVLQSSSRSENFNRPRKIKRLVPVQPANQPQIPRTPEGEKPLTPPQNNQNLNQNNRPQKGQNNPNQQQPQHNKQPQQPHFKRPEK